MIGIFVEMSKFEDALRECEKLAALRHSDLVSQGNFAYVYALSGRKEEGSRFLERNMKEIEANHLYPLDIADFYCTLGDRENALAWLMKAFEWHDSFLPFINEIPASDHLRSLRSDPRFIELLKKMGLRK